MVLLGLLGRIRARPGDREPPLHRGPRVLGAHRGGGGQSLRERHRIRYRPRAASSGWCSSRSSASGRRGTSGRVAPASFAGPDPWASGQPTAGYRHLGSPSPYGEPHQAPTYSDGTGQYGQPPTYPTADSGPYGTGQYAPTRLPVLPVAPGETPTRSQASPPPRRLPDTEPLTPFLPRQVDRPRAPRPHRPTALPRAGTPCRGDQPMSGRGGTARPGPPTRAGTALNGSRVRRSRWPARRNRCAGEPAPRVMPCVACLTRSLTNRRTGSPAELSVTTDRTRGRALRASSR